MHYSKKYAKLTGDIITTSIMKDSVLLLQFLERLS